LLRAQLIEEGFDVVAADVWPLVRDSLLRGDAPGLVVVDLQNLPRPRDVLRELGTLINPDRVLVLRAFASIAHDELEDGGFRVISRPLRIKQVVAHARAAIDSGEWPT
jgi:hypothetical protein